jgi:uncharacterized protein (TIGR03067 family)
MKVYLPIFLALTSLVGCSANKDAGDRDVKQLEGAWKVVSLTSGAEGDAPQEMIRDMIVVIKGDKWTTISRGQASEENFKLDTAKNPQTIDLTRTPIVGVVSDREHPVRPEVNREILPGIYDLDGDRLRICLANPGEKRPSQFPGKPQAGLVVLVLERDKSPGPEKKIMDMKIMAEIGKGGGYAHYGEPPAADQLYVSLDREKGDKELERIAPSLKRLSNITGLHLYDSKVTDAGLANLKGINNIEHINLSRTTTTDAGLAHLRGMTKLHLLIVTGTKVTDAGIAELKKALPKLEVEKLTPIQEKANDEINKAGGILYTNVGATVRVDFRGAAISDARLAELKPFLEVWKSSLKELNFLNSEMSDKGLIHLKGLTSLKRMKLKGAKVTAEGAQALEQAIPGLKIEL